MTDIPKQIYLRQCSKINATESVIVSLFSMKLITNTQWTFDSNSRPQTGPCDVHSEYRTKIA